MSATSEHYTDLRRRVGDAVYDALRQSTGPDAERLAQSVGDLPISEYRRRVDRLIAALDEPIPDDDNGRAAYFVRELLPGDNADYPTSTIIHADPAVIVRTLTEAGGQLIELRLATQWDVDRREASFAALAAALAAEPDDEA